MQDGIGATNSVEAIIGPLLATQTLAWDAPRGMPGAAFHVAGALIGAAAASIAWRVLRSPRTARPD